MWIDDAVLARSHLKIYHQVFIPTDSFIVLGSSNQAELECHTIECKKDGIEILQRKGGGGTVLLHSGCLIVSLGGWVTDPYHNSFYFKSINDSVIKTLSGIHKLDYNQRGFSDICIGDQKFCGTSLYRSKNYLLYQASILFDARLDLIEKYLKHPSKEPDYRKGKAHKEFITDLKTHGFRDLYQVKETFDLCFEKNLDLILVDVDLDHLKYLKKGL